MTANKNKAFLEKKIFNPWFSEFIKNFVQKIKI